MAKSVRLSPSLSITFTFALLFSASHSAFGDTPTPTPTPPACLTLPGVDPSSCLLAPSEFAGWFHSGTVGPDGVVDPPNGITFTPNAFNDCAFFKWSERMFLWATSPAPPSYGV